MITLGDNRNGSNLLSAVLLHAVYNTVVHLVPVSAQTFFSQGVLFVIAPAVLVAVTGRSAWWKRGQRMSWGQAASASVPASRLNGRGDDRTFERAMQPLVHSRVETRPPADRPVSRVVGLTIFYPRYDSGNDRVDRVARVQAVQFQPVLPRYELSTSETRRLGLGPMFAPIPEVSASSALAGGSPAGTLRQRSLRPAPERALREPWLGAQVDLLA